jgi:hypothetical protein
MAFGEPLGKHLCLRGFSAPIQAFDADEKAFCTHVS